MVAGVLEFEQAVSAVTVADVRISPDGRTVAYVTSEASTAGEAPESAIWLVDADGGTPRRLTTSDAADGSPRWSPDATRIAFTSDRKQRGVRQVYLLTVSGGEAVRLTDTRAGVAALAWSPDGSRLAYTVIEAEPEAEKQRREARNDHKVRDAFPPRAGLWIVDLPEDAAALAVIPEPKRLSPEGTAVAGFGWSPDGSTIAAFTGHSLLLEHQLVPEIMLYGVDGSVRSLGTVEGAGGEPEFSPDGSTLLLNAAHGRIPAIFALVLVPIAGGEQRRVLAGYDGSIFSQTWLADGQVLAGIETGQHHWFGTIDIANDELAPAHRRFERPGTGAYLVSATADGRRFAFNWADDYNVGNVYVCDIGGTPRQLTDLNPWTREQEWGEVREISWRSSDGMEMQGLLILPVGYVAGRRYPLLTHIHGGPMGAWTRHLYADWHDWGQFMAQRGFAVFMPNPRGSSGRGTEFLCGNVGCYGGPDWFDIETGIDFLIADGIADADRLVIGGWSGGGFLTNWAITHSERFKAAISGAGISNWVSFQGTADIRTAFNRFYGDVDEDPELHWEYSPIRAISRAATPTLILFGEADARVPVTQGYELYEGLKSRGVETQLVAYPREPHGIGERKHQIDLLQRVVAWYGRVLDA